MRIGLTYDSKEQYLAEGFSPLDAAEFDGAETIDGLDAAISRLGHEVERVGRLDALVAALAAGRRWDLVFNIAEGYRGPTRESQVPALLEAYGIPVTFGDSLCLALCLHKGHCKAVVDAAGIPTPRSLVVHDVDVDLRDHKLVYPLFAKPVAEGTGKGVTAAARVTDMESLRRVCGSLLAQFRQPVLVEEYLPGREFTVGVSGTGGGARVLGVMEVLLGEGADQAAYTFENKDNYEERVTYRLVDDAEAAAAASIALDSYRLLGCRDAGRVDIRSDAGGRPQFMEINPLAGLNPIHSDLPILCRLRGIGYDALIADILASATKRVRHG